jgi:uncharacterized protein (TIGR00251 family)
VHVQPRARQTVVDGWRDDVLRIRLAAQPVDGRANDALVEWLAGELGLPRRAVRVLRGQASRHKLLAIDTPTSVVAGWLQTVAPLRRG